MIPWNSSFCWSAVLPYLVALPPCQSAASMVCWVSSSWVNVLTALSRASSICLILASA